MKHTLIYVVLGMALLIGSSLFVSSGWAAEREIISFLAKKDGDFSIHLINTRGEPLQRLMVGPGRIGTFSWSPDGRSITYNSNQDGDPDIYVADVRTNVQHQLTFHDSRDIWPAWSPNGKWIAFISERAGEMDIYRMDANGENVMRLTNRGRCSRPAWSPDSRWIAFVSEQQNGEGIPNSVLYVMSAEGKGVRQLADTDSNGCAWSPDGKEVAFVPRMDAVGGTALFSIDKDGKNMRQLTRLYKGLVSIFRPIWSPSGKWIAYLLVQRPEGLLDGVLIPRAEFFANSVICVVDTADVGGGEPLESTRRLVYGSGLEWVPDGFLSVSPSSEKQTTLWGRLKQIEK